MTDEDIWNIEWVEGTPWRAGYWRVWDGLFEAYGRTVDEAIAELHRNMRVKDDE